MLVTLIVAIGNQGQIGLNGSLPWKLQSDLKFFKNTTINHVVIFGRKTFESIGKILPDRKNVIITKNNNYKQNDCFIFNNIRNAINNFNNEKEIFVCGGAEIYKYCLENNLINKIYLTKVDYNGTGDAFLDLKYFYNWNFKEIKNIIIDKYNNYNAKIFISNIKF